MKTTRLNYVLAISVLAFGSLAACGDDDAVNGGSTAGTSSSTAGSAGKGGSSNNNSGGEDSEGGTTATGGTQSVGGTSSGGADQQAGGAGGNGGEGGMGLGGADGGPAADLSDAQIFLVVDTLNAGEIDQAYAALPRLSAPKVRAYAQEMIADHSAARDANIQLADTLNINPAPSPLKAALKSESDAVVEMLLTSPDEPLDKPYIDSQVEMHAAALALLEDLQAAADKAQLKALLGTLQSRVEEHHMHALERQAELD